MDPLREAGKLFHILLQKRQEEQRFPETAAFRGNQGRLIRPETETRFLHDGSEVNGDKLGCSFVQPADYGQERQAVLIICAEPGKAGISLRIPDKLVRINGVKGLCSCRETFPEYSG